MRNSSASRIFARCRPSSRTFSASASTGSDQSSCGDFMSQPGLTTIFPALVSRRSASVISVMKRVEPQITTIRGRLSSFFASASFSSGVSSCGYDTGSSGWCGPRGACGDENEGVQDRFVTNDAGTLATALYGTTDDMLKEQPDLAPWRPPAGITPRLSDAELVTLAAMQAVSGCTSEAKRLRHARARLRHLFPCLPRQPGCSKRLRKAAGLMRSVNRILATTSVRRDDVWVVDPAPVECGRSRETVKRSGLAGWAEYGYCASHSRFFWGLRLHLACTLQGLPIAFALTGAKADERETLLDLLA